MDIWTSAAMILPRGPEPRRVVGSMPRATHNLAARGDMSHDSEAMLCLVPAEVACNLDAYCLEFGFSWVWNGPENGRFLKRINDDQMGAIFGAAEFIDYLNRWAFPGCGAKIIRGLGCYDYDLPEEYSSLPRHNF